MAEPSSAGADTALLTGRRDGRRVKVVEKFTGRRVRQRSGVWRRLRSAVALILIVAVTATLVAAVVALAVGSIALAIQHSLTPVP